jgi:putative FmdB family regulatory protein
MGLYQYKCSACNFLFDVISSYDTREHILPCTQCGQNAQYRIAVSNVDIESERPEWLKQTVEVVDHDSDAPHCREFINNPTRSNYRLWMMKEGLRHLEDGEKPSKPQGITKDQRKKYMLDQLMKRRKIEV